MSAFVLEDRVVYQVYSTYARGLALLGHVPVARPRAQRGATTRASSDAATMSTTASDAGGRLRHRPPQRRPFSRHARKAQKMNYP